MPPLIVIIEDDVQIRRVVEGYLRRAGYRVHTALDGPAGLAFIQRERPDLVILDIMLPGMDGLEVARRLRRSEDPAVAGVYIILLTARVEETDRVVGLELGADDYVTKPFSPRELTARVRAALRRLAEPRAHAASTRVEAGALVLDATYRRATLHGQEVDLTATEFDLLLHLMRQPGRPFTRSQLLDVTQPDALGDAAAYERTIDAHIKNIRKKLDDFGRRSRYIETVHGVGYRFLPQEPGA
ncbi:MAG: response regulator transcription factor [Caldilineaceae bacterium]|nr:response regulator transcription factor [Caldilineaceae bacterium]